MFRSSKRTLHHRLKSLQRLKVWQLLIIAVMLSFLTATALRLNNLGMVERRDDVYAADERGDPAEIKAALEDLQRYVNSHMNTDLGKGVYLQKSYERARDAALASATDTSNPQAAVYQQAGVDCQSRFQGGTESFRNDYVQCVVERVAAMNQSASPLGSLNLPKADLYRYDFVSPLWSPDLAGLLSLATALVLLAIIIRIGLSLLYKFLLRSRAYSVK